MTRIVVAPTSCCKARAHGAGWRAAGHRAPRTAHRAATAGPAAPARGPTPPAAAGRARVPPDSAPPGRQAETLDPVLRQKRIGSGRETQLRRHAQMRKETIVLRDVADAASRRIELRQVQTAELDLGRSGRRCRRSAADSATFPSRRVRGSRAGAPAATTPDRAESCRAVFGGTARGRSGSPQRRPLPDSRRPNYLRTGSPGRKGAPGPAFASRAIADRHHRRRDTRVGSRIGSIAGRPSAPNAT